MRDGRTHLATPTSNADAGMETGDDRVDGAMATENGETRCVEMDEDEQQQRRSVRERKPSLALTEATMTTMNGRKRREAEDGCDSVMSASAAKRASLEEEIERRRKLALGIVEDVARAWAEHGATPRRGAEAATEAWVQCDREACGKWRRVPRCVADALGAEDRFVCEDGKDGRFNACDRAQESTDADIDARLDESLAADAEARATAKKEIISERKKEYERKKRRINLEKRAQKGEIVLNDDGTWKKVPKAAKTKKNGESSGPPPPHPGPFDEWAWVQCESEACGKWRKMRQETADSLGSRDRWVCSMSSDRERCACSAPQELSDDEIHAFMLDQSTRLIEHQRQLQEHYAHYAKRGAPVPKGLIRVSVPLKDAAPQPPQPTRPVNRIPIDEGPEDAESWSPGTPRPMPPPAPSGRIPVQVPVVCAGIPGVYLPRRHRFRCHCEQPEHMCVRRSGEGDGRLFTGAEWEAHCGRAATRKYKASVRVLIDGPVSQMFIGRWFDAVGLAEASGSKQRAPKTKDVMIEVDDTFVPGPMNQLSLRNLMTIFGFILNGTATAPTPAPTEKKTGDEATLDQSEEERVKPEPKTEEEIRDDIEKEVGRLATVCKSWKLAALTVLQTAGVERAMTKNEDGSNLRTQFTVITEYVDRSDDKECQVERSVTLTEDHPYESGSKTRTAIVDDGKPPGWWPSLGVKTERKRLVTEAIEQETYGVDFVTGRDVTDTLKRVLPDFSDDDVWGLYKQLLSQVNASYGAMTPDTLATQSLAVAAEDLAEKLERQPGARSLAYSKAMWKLAAAATETPEFYYVHRKGFGVVCNMPIKKGEFVVDFLGEIYPPWAWAEKQDAIRSVQKGRGLRDCGPPEFYNMQIERPGGDAEGYSVLFCDAMHENNYAGRISHSCDPNIEVNLKAIDGKYEIHFITTRDIMPGEELAYNYHSCTDSMKEVEQAFCLCGARMCRGSYLNFVGADHHSQVLESKHKLMDRQVIMLKAIERSNKPLSAKQIRCLEMVGYYPGKGLLRNCPGWLLHFVGDIAVYMDTELNELPKHILEAMKKEHEKLLVKNPNMEFTYNEKFAKIDALAMRENRTQCVAIMLSKVRRLVTRPRDTSSQPSVYDRLNEFENAPPPLVELSEKDAVGVFWGSSTQNFEKSVLYGLVRAIGPHLRAGRDTDAFVKWSSELESIAEKTRSGKMKLRESLIWLRDDLMKLKQTVGARHKLAAGLIHLYAMTQRFWQPSSAPEHQSFKSGVVRVREDEVNAWGVGAGGGGDKIVAKVEKLYRPGFSAATMLQWHKQEISDPTQFVANNRKGNMMLPDIACCYATRAGQPVPRTGAREHEMWIAHMENYPGETWPQMSGPWGAVNSQKLIGSPFLDAWMDGSKSVSKSVIQWLKANSAPS